VSTSLDALDGLIGEAWAGDVPNGSHINVILGRRGSPTAAGAATMIAASRDGHTPFLACLGAGTVVRPATVVLNKATVKTERHALLTWGAAQLGIGQGVLDAVAEGLLEASQSADVVLLVALWVDPEAHDETAVRLANRAAMRDAIADALARSPQAQLRELIASRDAARNAFYSGE
jgi:5,6,7,8-tetrahydromethanopterin hydro-lyase